MLKLPSMKKIEEIADGKNKLAIVVRRDVKVDGIKFFTDENNPFQIGVHERKKGVSLTPHFHVLDHPLTIYSIQEILLIQKGKIRISLYSKKNKLIAKVVLNSGDTILLIDGGHGVDFLEDSRVFEVKQGPYPGSKKAKMYISK